MHLKIYDGTTHTCMSQAPRGLGSSFHSVPCIGCTWPDVWITVTLSAYQEAFGQTFKNLTCTVHMLPETVLVKKYIY